VDLTDSYKQAVPQDVLDRYDWLETRNAAVILDATNPAEFADLVDVLLNFKVKPVEDIMTAGGNESEAPGRLNEAFRQKGWREGAYKVTLASTLTLKPWAASGETVPTTADSGSDSTSYLVDNLKGRVAVDIEWHAKDGNLDRDLAAYRSLHSEGIIDAAGIITMTRVPMREWAVELGASATKFQTSTTTNVEKLIPRLNRGDGGGCPVLVAGICRRTI